jgi:DNA-binding GntR family transcriptional regulator
MVTFHPHRGARVRTLSEVQINEIYRLRMLLERYALQLSMAKMKPERIKRLRELAEKMEEVPEGPELVQLRSQFYREVYDSESNPLAVEMIEDLRGHVGRYLLSFRVHLEHHRSHSELVDYMEAGDLSAAENWLAAHLEEVRRGIQELVSTNGESRADGDDSVAVPVNSRVPAS